MPRVCVTQLGHTRAVLCSQHPWEPGASNLLAGHVQPETIFQEGVTPMGTPGSSGTG